MHDSGRTERQPLVPQGIVGHPGAKLVDRAIERLSSGPVESALLARDVVGLGKVPALVAERVAVALLGADPRIQRLSDGRWALAQVRLGSPRLSDCAFAVVDVETTGTRPGGGDRIVEIAIIALVGSNIETVYHSLVDPGRPIPRFASALTRITDSMVHGKPTFTEIADDVLAALAGRVFAAHNVRFDWLFLAREMRSARDVVLEGPRLCTVDLARRLIPGLRSRNLDSVAAYFGIEIANRHRAADDAMATARALQRLLDLARDRGAITLDDLRRLGQLRFRKRSALPRSTDTL